ncbi:UDP-glucose 4-epimerase [Bosea caraganae]|uniref:UDP-glucose 4-epimerase n=1 Tax=Bosea caraganae TaxID=2763117 RepID=A0A370L4R3_9HYPH|nr:NAD-dependent epimerase/dehydratase family protein [Bosea caraganae]RDJ24077.1 UDP-glucose 4-epimerase [Bosea caraganae]RDJ30119.1 UDP-glucose 4-epimerase [Bosea caraganae]
MNNGHDRILITGGNGYVGRQVTRQLYGRHEICIADNIRYGQVRFSDDELKRIRLERVDITDQRAIAELVADFRPDAIIHLAAIHYIPECEQEPAKALLTNVVGVMNLLLAAPEGCCFVYASSGAVYKPDTQPHCEGTAALEPNDVYGLNKLHGEHYVRYLAKQRSLAAVVVRLFNVVGPGETNPHLLPEIVAQLKAGRTTLKLGNRWPKRDYIHVEDAARGFATIATDAGLEPGATVTVNLGTSHPYSVDEILSKLRGIAQIRFALEQDSDRVRAVDRPFLAADTTQIRQLFGWEPEFTIDDALSDLWRAPDLSEALTAKYR